MSWPGDKLAAASHVLLRIFCSKRKTATQCTSVLFKDTRSPLLITAWHLTKSIQFQQSSHKMSHYSKSQIFVQKFNFDKTPNIFTSYFTQNFFWQFFSWNQSCQQLKSPKPQHFREFFTPQKLTIFSENQSWIFGQKMKISNSVRHMQTITLGALWQHYGVQ